MIELPSTPWLANSSQAMAAVAASAPVDIAWSEIAGEVRHQFTHIDLTCRLLRGRLAHGAIAGIWTPPSRFGELALPSVTMKLLQHAAPARRRTTRARRPADGAAGAGRDRHEVEP